MGQKIHPIGFRLAVNRDWRSRWFATPRDFAGMLKQDIEIRNYVKKTLAHASIGRVSIERPSKSARITIFSARPGVVIGKKGEGIEKLRQDIQKKLGLSAVAVNIEELRKPELDAHIIADNIAQQLEKRIMFRRAMRRAIQQTMRFGAQGVKVMCSGRLNGIEIARSESYREGRVPLHTLRSNIDYALSEAKTTYGIIGVKVWVYRGDNLVPDASSEAQKNQFSSMIEEGESDQSNVSRIVHRRVLKKAIIEQSASLEKEAASDQVEGKSVSKSKEATKKVKSSTRKAKTTVNEEKPKPKMKKKEEISEEKEDAVKKKAQKTTKKEDLVSDSVKLQPAKKRAPKSEKAKKRDKAQADDQGA